MRIPLDTDDSWVTSRGSNVMCGMGMRALASEPPLMSFQCACGACDAGAGAIFFMRGTRLAATRQASIRTRNASA